MNSDLFDTLASDHAKVIGSTLVAMISLAFGLIVFILHFRRKSRINNKASQIYIARSNEWLEAAKKDYYKDQEIKGKQYH